MKKLNYSIVWFIALAVIAGALLLFESNLLWKLQEMNLFLTTPMFFRDQMVVPGGLLSWAGTFLTQLFRWPWLGVLVLCGCWWLLMWLTKRAFRIPAQWAGLLLIPVGMLLLTIVDFGYCLYVLKQPGYAFVSTLGAVVVAALLWAYRCLPAKRYLRTAFIVLTCVVGYPLFGIYGLAAPLLMALWSWRLREHALVDTLVALLCVVAVPLLCYRFVYYQTNLANIYYAALPLYFVTEERHTYYIPFYLLALFYVAMIFAPLKPAAKPLRPLLLQAVLLALLVAGVARYWFKDENFHRELAMQHHIEKLDWEDVLQEAARQQDEPTRAIVMMKNLALFRLGRQGDEMYHYKTGAKAHNAPMRVNMTQVVGRAIYYEYGQANYCYRWCLEDGVEFGWRAEYLKYMTRCALVNGETEVAKKYIQLLKHTRFHKEWAEAQEQYAYHPETMKDNEEYAIVKRLMMQEDHLGSDNGLAEMYLMNILLDVNSFDPLVQELTLLSALWKKDIGLFWPRFFNYANLHKGEHMPRHYQEAAYLYGHLEHQVDISKMPFDEDVVRNYNDFMALAQRCQGMTEEQMKSLFYPQFGKTFYYEYFLIRNQKSN